MNSLNNFKNCSNQLSNKKDLKNHSNQNNTMKK